MEKEKKVQEILKKLKSRKYVRYKINENLIKKSVEYFIYNNKPIRFYTFWGLHVKVFENDNIKYTKEGLEIIRSYLSRINEIHPIEYYIIYSDFHMEFNKIDKIYINTYRKILKNFIEDMELKYFKLINLSGIVLKYQSNFDKCFIDCVNNLDLNKIEKDLLEILNKSVKKFRPNEENYNETIKRYICIRKCELSYILDYLGEHSIMLTFNSPSYNKIFFREFPYIVLKKVGEEKNKIPWSP